MGIDILLLRDPTTANIVRESERRRYRNPQVVDEIIDVDQLWRRLQYLYEASKRLVNDVSKMVGQKKKAKEADGEDSPLPADVMQGAQDGKLDKETLCKLSVLQLKSLSKWFQDRVKQLQSEAEEASKKRDSMLGHVGNIVHESVPVEYDETVGNTVVRTFGECVKKACHKLNHVDLMEKLGCMDTSKSVTQMAGGRAFVLRGGLVQLQLALVNYGMSFLCSRSYQPFYPPFFMTKESMAAVAQLNQFDEELYKVSGEGEDKYLIATSEMPIAAYHADKWITDLPEPVKYVGVSTCFRKEVGSHGRDTLGIFRVHQFDKLEQFMLCSPRDNNSWKLLDEMIHNSEEFYKSLGIPYRVVNICSGALNNAAAKKFDLEGFFPSSDTFKELVSCSNCTDYQSRAVNCRFGSNARGQAATNVKEYVHMLNGTLCAVTRTMCCLVENYQTDEGILIPEALRPYMMGKEMLRFDEAPPKF